MSDNRCTLNDSTLVVYGETMKNRLDVAAEKMQLTNEEAAVFLLNAGLVGGVLYTNHCCCEKCNRYSTILRIIPPENLMATGAAFGKRIDQPTDVLDGEEACTAPADPQVH